MVPAATSVSLRRARAGYSANAVYGVSRPSVHAPSRHLRRQGCLTIERLSVLRHADLARHIPAGRPVRGQKRSGRWSGLSFHPWAFSLSQRDHFRRPVHDMGDGRLSDELAGFSVRTVQESAQPVLNVRGLLLGFGQAEDVVARVGQRDDWLAFRRHDGPDQPHRPTHARNSASTTRDSRALAGIGSGPIRSLFPVRRRFSRPRGPRSAARYRAAAFAGSSLQTTGRASRRRILPSSAG